MRLLILLLIFLNKFQYQIFKLLFFLYFLSSFQNISIIEYKLIQSQYFMINQKVSYQRQFLKTWRECYQANTFINPSYEVKQSMECKKVDHYYIIKNFQYKHKRATDNLNKNLETKRIQLPYSQKDFNFTKIKQREILFCVNFQNGQLSHVQSMQSGEHFIIISGFPVVQGHSLFVPCLKDEQPQIINAKLLKLTLKLSFMLPQMKLGYNSQGAGSSVNHFHVQMMNCTEFIPSNRFFFQHESGILIYHFSNLINQIKIYVFQCHQACYLKFHSSKPLVNIEERIVDIMMIVLNTLLQQSIPHNIIFTDINTVFIILRGFANNEYKYGCLEYSGIYVAKSQQEFNIEAKEIEKGFKTLSMESNQNILKVITKKLEKSQNQYY